MIPRIADVFRPIMGPQRQKRAMKNYQPWKISAGPREYAGTALTFVGSELEASPAGTTCLDGRETEAQQWPRPSDVKFIEGQTRPPSPFFVVRPFADNFATVIASTQVEFRPKAAGKLAVSRQLVAPIICPSPYIWRILSNSESGKLRPLLIVSAKQCELVAPRQ